MNVNDQTHVNNSQNKLHHEMLVMQARSDFLWMLTAFSCDLQNGRSISQLLSI